MAHKTLVGGTAYEIKGGRTLVGGTGYDISKGRTLVGGTGYDINFGMKIGDLPVGTIMNIPFKGSLKQFVIVNQGKPSSIYDNSCDGTWLMAVNGYEVRTFDSSDNDYGNSDIHAYMNNTVIGSFDSAIQDVIKQVKIPYLKGAGNAGTIRTGANGLSAKIFLLSGYEVGWTTANYSALPVDGACLTYFSGCAATDSKRKGQNANGAWTTWWLRSARKSNAADVVTVDGDGGRSTTKYHTNGGMRFAFVVDSATQVNPDDNTIAV